MLCCRPPVAVPERLSLVHSPCAGLVSAGTADLVIRNIPMIDFVRPVGIMDAFLFIRSGLKRLFFGLRKTFSHKRRTRCSWQGQALPPPGPLRTWKPPFLPMDHRHSVLHPQSPPGKGPGPKPRPAGSDDLFHRKALPFSRYFAFCQGVIPNTIVSYRFLFFNYRFSFCIILRFSWFCVIGLPAVFFAPPGPGSHLASRFVKLLSKCGGGQVPPNFSLFLRGAAS